MLSNNAGQMPTENGWVYLEVKTDHYIHEEDIKKMKAIKADILSITPVLPEDESEDFPPLT